MVATLLAFSSITVGAQPAPSPTCEVTVQGRIARIQVEGIIIEYPHTFDGMSVGDAFEYVLDVESVKTPREDPSVPPQALLNASLYKSISARFSLGSRVFAASYQQVFVAKRLSGTALDFQIIHATVQSSPAIVAMPLGEEGWALLGISINSVPTGCEREGRHARDDSTVSA
jgi:hypothetical protein